MSFRISSSRGFFCFSGDVPVWSGALGRFVVKGIGASRSMRAGGKSAEKLARSARYGRRLSRNGDRLEPKWLRTTWLVIDCLLFATSMLLKLRIVFFSPLQCWEWLRDFSYKVLYVFWPSPSRTRNTRQCGPKTPSGGTKMHENGSCERTPDIFSKVVQLICANGATFFGFYIYI